MSDLTPDFTRLYMSEPTASGPQTGQYQKNRTYSLTIGDTRTGTAFVIEPPLNVQFSIEKFLCNVGKPNKATFKIYGLNTETRKWLEKLQYPTVNFSAGYADSGSALIFTGHAALHWADKQGTDIVYTLSCTESFIELYNVIPSKTFSAGSTVEDIINYVVSNMQDIVLMPNENEADSKSNVALKLNSIIQPGTKKTTKVKKLLSSGYPCEGAPRFIFDDLAKTYKLQWRLDMKRLYFRDDGGLFTLPPTEDFVFTPRTGLVDIPHRHQISDGRETNDPALTQGVLFKCLLNPFITVGSIVKVQSDVGNIDGLFQVRNLKISGQYRGNDWFCEAITNEIKMSLV